MYQALYRKYRPQTFDDVVGQKSITETLKTQLITGKLSHAYLFTGTRGTGKTSCAKILAKAVNCLHPVDGNPCNQCAACRSIDSGSCMDVLEIDAASNNGVDNVRALRDDAIYTPAEVKMRVYIIDEVHMLSMSAFNALLKIIEEPPEHLLFILATTELHKVPATILSRCQRFSFRRLLPEDIAGRINYAAYQENIEIDDDAIRLLARLADGALRDGLSLLDQCASASRGRVTAQTVADCLGLAGVRLTAKMLEAIAAKDSKRALLLFSQLYAEGKDLAAMLSEMCGLTRDLLLLKTMGDDGKSMISGACTEQEMQALLPLFTGAELLRITDLLQQTASGFQRSANRRIDVELCLMQLCQPEMSLDAMALNARLSRLEEQVKSGVVVSAPTPQNTDDDVPPMLTDADAPPPEEPPQVQRQPSVPEAGKDFWQKLRMQLLSSADSPTVRRFFNPDMPISGSLVQNTLTILAPDDCTRAQLDNEKMKTWMAEQASQLLGRAVRVQILQRGRQGTANAENFNQFVKNLKNPEFQDVTNMKES